MLLVQWKKAANITCLDTARQVLEMMRSIETSARGEIVLGTGKHVTTITVAEFRSNYKISHIANVFFVCAIPTQSLLA